MSGIKYTAAERTITNTINSQTNGRPPACRFILKRKASTLLLQNSTILFYMNTYHGCLPSNTIVNAAKQTTPKKLCTNNTFALPLLSNVAFLRTKKYTPKRIGSVTISIKYITY